MKLLMIMALSLFSTAQTLACEKVIKKFCPKGLTSECLFKHEKQIGQKCVNMASEFIFESDPCIKAMDSLCEKSKDSDCEVKSIKKLPPKCQKQYSQAYQMGHDFEKNCQPAIEKMCQGKQGNEFGKCLQAAFKSSKLPQKCKKIFN